MKCLRSGYCCFSYDVMIIDDPSLGIKEDNVIHKKCGERCQHLLGDNPGEYSCAIHDEPWYKKTPCFDYDQISEHPNDFCRMGEYILSQEEDLTKG